MFGLVRSRLALASLLEFENAARALRIRLRLGDSPFGNICTGEEGAGDLSLVTRRVSGSWEGEESLRKNGAPRKTAMAAAME